MGRNNFLPKCLFSLIFRPCYFIFFHTWWVGWVGFGKYRKFHIIFLKASLIFSIFWKKLLFKQIFASKDAIFDFEIEWSCNMHNFFLNIHNFGLDLLYMCLCSHFMPFGAKKLKVENDHHWSPQKLECSTFFTLPWYVSLHVYWIWIFT